MARLIPNVRVDEIPFDSERLVLEALMPLPHDYIVLHSFPWLRPSRNFTNQPLKEGEADFVILHPLRGMLVVEVKGGEPKYKDRQWSRGGREMRDPFEQARRNRYALLESIETRTGRQLHRQMFTYGDLVVFPHSIFDGELPLNAEPRIVVDANGLAELPSRVEQAFEAWSRGPSMLTPSLFAEMQTALMPRLRLMRCVGTELELERAQIIQVTENQRAALQGLLASDRVLVEGTAGSGKTLLAMEFAISLAAKGQAVLFLCFNRHLKAWLHEQLSNEPRLKTCTGSLEVATFHSYAFSLARTAGVEFAPPAQGDQQFWDEEAPMILEQALELLGTNSSPPPYDAVIIDEAQDFSQDWWVTIEGLTRGGSNGRLYVFLDLHQSLRHEPKLPPVPLPARFRLTTNCRNTRVIARSAGILIDADTTLLPHSPEGEPPAMRSAQSAAADMGLALNEVRALLRSGVTARQIAVIQPAAFENSLFARIATVEEINLVSDAAAWRRGQGILVTTSRAFKGLEADVVILCGLSSLGAAFTLSDLYVAWTRARHRLIVVTHGIEPRNKIEYAIAEAMRDLDREVQEREQILS